MGTFHSLQLSRHYQQNIEQVDLEVQTYSTYLDCYVAGTLQKMNPTYHLEASQFDIFKP